MPSREAALTALYDRLTAATADPGLLLTDDALRDAENLAESTDTTTDPVAAQALGWFHWNRHLSLPDRDGQSDRAAAIRYFVPVYLVSPNTFPAPIRRAIRHHEQASARWHAGSALASDQADRLFSIYQSNGDLPALINAIALFREAVAAAPDGDAGRAACLSNLGASLWTLFERTGDMEALTGAIRVMREAVAAAPDGHPDRAMRMNNLGNALQAMSGRTGDADALTEAIQVTTEAVAAAPHGHPNRAVYLSNLGAALLTRFERTGDAKVLAEAIRVMGEAVSATPDGHPDRPMRLGNLGVALATRFKRTGDLEALTEAIRVMKEAVVAAADRPDRAKGLSNLGAILAMRFERTGDLEVLAEAIRVMKEAVSATPDGHPDRARHLSNLGAALLTRSERTGDMEALAEAIRVMKDGVAAAPDDHPERATYQTNLGKALQMRSMRMGDTEALTEAIQAGRDAVTVSPDGHSSRAMHLNNLGMVLAARFERTGDTQTLAEAIQAIREAVAATPDGHPDRAMHLSNLGAVLAARFERTGDTQTLAEAIQAMREAVAAAPDDHPNRAAYLNNLGNALQTMSGWRTGDGEALAEAIRVMREAVAAAPDDHPERGRYLSNLCGALQVLCERTGDTGALTEAIQAGRDAVAATPKGHSNHAMYLNNLGNALQSMSGRTGNGKALAEAIQVMREAVTAAPDDHPERAKYLSNLGNALQVLSARTGDTGALTEAIVCLQAAGRSTTSAAPVRIRSWRLAAVLLVDGASQGAQDALAAAEAAVELLPQVTPRSLARADREHRLGEVGSLAGVAAAAAIAAGRPERAVELLEQTRGVLVADTVDARSSDLTRLRETDPELAAAFEELRARLDALDQPGAIHLDCLDGSGTPQGIEQSRWAARDLGLAAARRDAQAAWDQLISRIRGMDGYAGFLAAPSIRNLAVQAHDGPIVFVSASPARCDALIVTHDLHAPVRLVPLPALTESAATDQAVRLREACRDATNPLQEPASRMAAQGKVLEVLAWIWDTITEPVLTALGHTATPSRGEIWPRVWWCPVGVLAYLPLHAAGYHSDLTATDPTLKANPRTVLDRVISSYTTTMRGLAYARTHHADTGNSRAVVVAVPDAPDTPPLPGVTAETETLGRYLPDSLPLADPIRDTVLAALPGHHVAHFACHGYADWNDPASSRLILRDHHTTPLTVADVGALHLNGGLAYLSACDTTITSPHLADEAVHITGAFHLAGYQHVVGTLWSISDAMAHDITEDFYDDLTAGGTTPPQTSRSAQALHHAVRRLRARYPQAPTLWAAHTHTGT